MATKSSTTPTSSSDNPRDKIKINANSSEIVAVKNTPDTIAMDNSTVESPIEEKNKPGNHGPMFGRVDMSTWRRILVFISLCFGILLSLMDTSIMATAIYTIALDFNSLANSFWAVLAYQLAYLGFAVVFARISDFVGRRVGIISAFVIFIAFSLACGWSKNITQLIVFRTLQGVGGAGLYSLSLILLIEVSTARLIALTSSMIGATIAISGVLGPIIGGLFTNFVTWRWIFWLNGPVGVCALLCFIIGWPNNITAYDTSRRSFREFDYIGTLLLIGASVLVVFGLQEAGSGQYHWNSPTVLGTIISGCFCWILLFGWEFYVEKKRSKSIAAMFPFRLITFRPMLAGIISTMLTGFTFFAIIIGLPLRFQLVNLFSPAQAGVHLLPLLCFSGFGSFLSGVVSRKLNNTFPTLMVAGCFVLLGTGLLSTLGSSLSVETKIYGFQILTGLGFGATIATVSMMTSLTADFDTHAVAQGIVSQMRIFGGSIGVAASNAIFQATCVSNLHGILTPSEIQSLQTNTRILTTLGDTSREAVRVAYADSFNQTLRVCTYMAAVCVVINIFTWQKHPPQMAQRQQKPKVIEPSMAESKQQKDEEAQITPQGKEEGQGQAQNLPVARDTNSQENKDEGT